MSNEYEIEHRNLFSEIQNKVMQILKDDELLQDWGVTVLAENIKDIDFEIKNAMSRQGIVAVVTTMQGTYQGHDSLVEAWQIDNLEIDIVENPSINRPRLKKLGLEGGVATDVGYRILEVLGGPQSGHFGVFCPKTFEIGENASLVVAKCKFSCMFQNEIDGIVDKETKVKIPFVTHVEIDGLISEIDSLKALVEGFDTEEIKADIEDLKEADNALGVRIDGLADVYQPKGNYALTSDIPTKVSQLINDKGYLTAVYWNAVQEKPNLALVADIPTKVSELANDEGFLKSVGWNEVQDKPDVALAADIPTKVSQLENDADYIVNVYWNDIVDKPDVALKTEIPTKTSQLQNNSGFLTAVTWNDVGLKPQLVTPGDMPNYLSEYPTNSQMTSYVDQRISEVQPGGDSTRLYNYTKNKYIDGNKVAWESTPVPGFDKWVCGWSEETPGGFFTMELSSDGAWYYNGGTEWLGKGNWKLSYIGEDKWSLELLEQGGQPMPFGSIELAGGPNSELLQGTYEHGYTITLKRFKQDPYSEWTQEGVLALTSQIPQNVSQLNNDANYLTEVSWQDVKDKPDVALTSDIPTKVSDLENDAGYLTQHQSLEGYATKDYVDDGIQDEVEARVEEDNRLQAMIEQKADGSSIPTKVSELENDEGFLTTVAWTDIPGRPDMENYATLAYVGEEVHEAMGTVDGKIEDRAPLIRRWSI